ncbi:hypothetical protein TKK_0005245 [Trichogramma kaykai]|uniref:Zinc-hook domain-containing protein n=1 Tax=Trichogramma kaykai TaxID=54128 RepID=A0ABD2XHI3_9HYME
MSKVKDLEIRGIRNFGDETSKNRIHFSTPLTLILGPNGTGKTTIIEALKYVTSGEYPPDSERGKAFVHEPKLTSTHSVRGQVKAKIIDKHGNEIIVVRTCQVSRIKSGTLKFQALDNTLKRFNPKTQQEATITSRCADIDREMLNAMGVSKPILNYVIFCHQEESNWPLEDGKKLKERFDEIFDTSKYNKAMEAATKLIKDSTGKLNLLREREKGLAKIVEEVKDKEENLRNCQMREEEATQKIKDIQDKIKPIDEQMNDFLDVKEKHKKIEEKLRMVESSYKMSKNYIENLKQHIKHIHKGTLEELISKIETFDTNLTQKKDEQSIYIEELETLDRNERKIKHKLDDARTQLGALKQKQIEYHEKVSKRNELLFKALDTWEITHDSEFSETEVTSNMNLIKNKLDEFKSSMKDKLKENEQEERYLQNVVDESRAHKTGIESEISLKQKEKEEIKQEINECRKKIKETGEAGTKLSIFESNLQTATQQYENLLKDFNEESLKEELQKYNKQRKEYDSRITLLDQEINSLHKLSSMQAELELHQNQLKDKEVEISALKKKHSNNLMVFFGSETVPEKQFKKHIEKIHSSLLKEKNELSKEIDNKQQKLTSLITTQKHKDAELEKAISELNEYEMKVSVKCDGQDYEEILLLQERKVKSLQDQRGIYANQKLMYEEFLKKMKKKTCCPLCDRGLGSAEEKQLEQKMLAEIKKSPQSLKQCEAELKQEQAHYDALQQLKPVTEEINKMQRIKIPQMRSQLSKTKSEIQKLDSDLENLKILISEPENKLEVYKSMYSDVTLLDNHLAELDKLNSLIDEKKDSMSKAGKIGDRSMQEVQNERQALKKRFSTVETKAEEIQSKIQIGQEKVQKAREQKNKLNEEIIRVKQDMQALNQIKAKVKDLYTKETSLEESLKVLRSNFVKAEEDLSLKVEELSSLKKKNREEQDKDMNFKSTINTVYHELEIVQEEVKKFIKNKVEESLENVESIVKKLSTESEKLKESRESLEEKVRFLKELCMSEESGKRDLENNLDLLKKQEKMEELKKDYNELQDELEELKYEQRKKKYNALFEEKEIMEKEISTKQGSLIELDKTIKEIKRSLNKEDFRMARKNYKALTLELQVREEAIANLKSFTQVLDGAMIKFHEERMATVNTMMKKLWTHVYGGNDTTSIQIRVQKTEGIGDKKRSYNYKLVQIKHSKEMDMKGKCSAGQKVLASIIIRMALAETFCAECSVLALDEPTTNLDDENATNLAVTLSKVIQHRAQHSKNFQLIVISHDEKFIGHLSNLSGKQMFHELYRNIDGYSLVRRRDMTDFRQHSQTQASATYGGDPDFTEEEEEDDNQEPNTIKKEIMIDSDEEDINAKLMSNRARVAAAPAKKALARQPVAKKAPARTTATAKKQPAKTMPTRQLDISSFRRPTTQSQVPTQISDDDDDDSPPRAGVSWQVRRPTQCLPDSEEQMSAKSSKQITRKRSVIDDSPPRKTGRQVKKHALDLLDDSPPRSTRQSKKREFARLDDSPPTQRQTLDDLDDSPPKAQSRKRNLDLDSPPSSSHKKRAFF